MSWSRRDFLAASAAAGIVAATKPNPSVAQTAPTSEPTDKPDRQATVRRNNPVNKGWDPFNALSIGNGHFCFTADPTGLQTFPELYEKDFPLCTTATWAWHSFPKPDNLDPAAFKYKEYDVYGRKVPYDTSSTGQKELFDYLRENPHRFHIGRIGLVLKNADGSPAKPEDLKNIEQTLDLWTGTITSKFELQGKPVTVTTCVHPLHYSLAVRIESPLLQSGAIGVMLAFPYPSTKVPMADWNSPDKHVSTMSSNAEYVEVARQLDDVQKFRELDRVSSYSVKIKLSAGSVQQQQKHVFSVVPSSGDPLELTLLFGETPWVGTGIPPQVRSFDETLDIAGKGWQDFWSTGGALDFSACTDLRAPELERRIILSQYNVALHCASGGYMPPSETGILFNSWYGKSHLEMAWWHGVHFYCWNRYSLWEPNLTFYQRIIGVARDIAKRQGYAGVRWPKMVGPDGLDSPSPVGPLLIWQQPHAIYFAELAYRHDPTPATLDAWKEIVFETANFMASYAVEKDGRYVLGPPMKTVSENADTLATINPTFELAYWRFGLRVAQEWKHRLNLPRDDNWDKVLNGLAMPAIQDDLYLMQEGMTDTYTKWNWEHPALTGALGMQPGDGIKPATMARTLVKVMEVWQLDRAWGWDFPMLAMCAARTQQPELAIEALLKASPKNHYHPNGHVYQRPDLTAYLPANGGLLSSIALMCAGWDGAPDRPTPGFPADGKWKVKWENLRGLL